MLAQNFKTSGELKIEERSLSALITVLGMLERNELTHTHRAQIRDGFNYGFSGQFNMDMWSHPSECGSVACIGGTCELIGSFLFTDDEKRQLHPLFYPSTVQGWEKITSEQAATALRSYLTTGEANWKAALSSTHTTTKGG